MQGGVFLLWTEKECGTIDLENKYQEATKKRNGAFYTTGTVSADLLHGRTYFGDCAIKN